MATSYKTPGVYVEEISVFPPSIAQVETAIPAFIGYTEKAVDEKGESLVDVPTRIKSLLEYEQYFGTAQPETGIEVTFEETTDGDERVALSATAVLEDGDRSVFRMYYAMKHFFSNGGGPCYVVSTGEFGEDADSPVTALNDDDLSDGLSKVETEDEPTLIVFPEGPQLAANAYHGLQQSSLSQCADLGDRFAVIDVQPVEDAAEDFRSAIGVNNLKYGAAYYPDLVTDLEYVYEDADVAYSGIDVEGVADGEETMDKLQDGDTQAYNVAKAAIEKLEMTLPPSPAVVGVYSYVDRTRGVWKAPANVSLSHVIRPAVKISHDDQQSLNVHTSGKSINAIRSFTGRGVLVWGARTLAGNDNEWRYISVRRFFNMVEESTKKATAQFVFEPNDANTWVKVRGMVENFLLLQWRAGALVGAKPEQAFYVNVGLGQTMTALDILEGRMIVEIGMAVVRPAEFIILRFMHKMQEA